MADYSGSNPLLSVDMTTKMLNCLFCGKDLESQSVNDEIGVYCGWCADHNWVEVEYYVTEDNEYVVEEFESYDYVWDNRSEKKEDVSEKVECIHCPLCDEVVTPMRAVALDNIDKWDSYTFECPKHGVMKLKVECYSVYCEKDADQVDALYSIGGIL